jgi:hypothetical protein
VRLSQSFLQINTNIFWSELDFISCTRIRRCENLIEQGDSSRNRQYHSLNDSLANLQDGMNKSDLNIVTLIQDLSRSQQLGFQNILDRIDAKFEAPMSLPDRGHTGSVIRHRQTLPMSQADHVTMFNSSQAHFEEFPLPFQHFQHGAREDSPPITSDVADQASWLWDFLLRCREGLNMLLSSTNIRRREIYSRQAGLMSWKDYRRYLRWLKAR